METGIQRVALFILPFLFSLSFHEFAHAWASNKLGDPTAKYMGRLTLNPMAHIDWVWTVIIPIITIVVGGVYFGAAKPVPIDTRNFKNPQKDMALSALAGPMSNIFLGIVFSFLFVASQLFLPKTGFWSPLAQMLQAGVIINFFLAFFNLIPLPPLDGSKILGMFLSYRQALYIERFAPFSFILILVFWQLGVLHYIIYLPAQLFYKFSILTSYNILAVLS